MSNSLKDQLLKAGLVKKNDVKQTRKKKAPTQAKKNRNKVSEHTLRTQRAMLDKAKKDKKLNQQRQAEAEQKARYAQVVQLVDSSKLDRSDGETAYNFTYKKKVKTVYVTVDQQKQLTRGQIAIVILDAERFELVPNVVAEKIAQRDKKYVVAIDVKEDETVAADDPYADYQIPDDLVW